nr:hypothetical protein 31 [bacterium]
MNEARIGVDNVFRQGVLSASSEDTAQNGFYENAVNGLTFDYWRPLGYPATLEVELSESTPVNYALIASHSGLTFVFQYHDGSGWENLHAPIIDQTGLVKAVFFTQVLATRYRIKVNASENGAPRLGVVMLGKYTELPRKFYGGHAPIALNRNVKLLRNETEGGFMAGTYALRTGASTSVTVRHISAAWVRDNLENMNDLLRVQPFMFSWRPDSEPNDVAYGWLNKSIKATNSGLRNLMDLTFEISGTVRGT